MKKSVMDKRRLDLAKVNALKLQPESLVNTEIAAVVLDMHQVTLRVWRRQGRGPAFIKDLEGGLYGDVRYRYGDIQDWLRANTVDPSKPKELAAPVTSKGDANWNGQQLRDFMRGCGDF